MNYNTKSRRAILELFEGGDISLTTEQITERLQGIPPSTLYRRLASLCGEGLLSRYRSADGSYVYRAAELEKCACSFHLKCRFCGCVEHLRCDRGAELLSHIGEHHGFKPDKGKTVLLGRCAACADKEAQG